MQEDGIDDRVHLHVAKTSGGVGQRVAANPDTFDRQVGDPHQVSQHRVLG